MIRKKYLIWVDILGFLHIPSEIAKIHKINEEKVKNDFLNTIEEKIASLEAEKKIIGRNYSQRDDWLLVTDSLSSVYEIIAKILNHNSGYESHNQIPLEFAIGTADYDKWATLNGRDLIIRKGTTDFIRSKILNSYHEWYKIQNKGKPIKSSYIIFTEAVYQDLESFDKKSCSKISYKKSAESQAITFYIFNIQNIRQRGLVFEFLEKIEYPYKGQYDRIDMVYICPKEYEEIKDMLMEKKIVFISGTPEYGKTYTAIRLLWEYFNKGFEPKWIKAKELTERSHVREALENIKTYLLPKHIIYFEDPFGSFRYEKRESLEREIGTIINLVEANKDNDAYAIITSREEVFKEFKYESYLSAKEIEDFEKKLNLKKPSYGVKERKEILLKWAEVNNCKWLNDEYLKYIIIDELEEGKLPTPLNIKEFTIISKDVIDKSALIKLIKLRSEDTAKTFAKEIKSMTDDKILFLAFLFIFYEGISIGFIEKTYRSLLDELRIKEALDFDDTLKWFIEDKISEVGYSNRILLDEKKSTILNQILKAYSNRHLRKITLLRFVHPSYIESFKYVLTSKGNKPTRICKEIVSNLLIKLSFNDKAAESVARCTLNNFDMLPEDVRNTLLLNLSKHKEAAEYAIRCISNNFDMLPEDVRNTLLLNLSKFAEIAESVARCISNNFDILPEDVRNTLLLNLSKFYKAALYIATILIEKYDFIPERIRKLLNKISDNDQSAWLIARTLSTKFDQFSEDTLHSLLLECSRKETAVGYVIWFLIDNYKKLPKKLKKILLFLATNDKHATYIANIICKKANNLPQTIRRKLLMQISKKDVENIVFLIASDFSELPKDIQNLLDNLQGSLQKFIRRLSDSLNPWYNLMALHLISNTFTKLNSNFVLKILSNLNRSKNMRVKDKASQMISKF